MKLFIVESPNKCVKIKSYLGADYNVMASVGHIREIPKKGINIDVKNGFVPKYEISKDKKDVVKKIQEAAKKADEIFLATDMDREGEGIAFHIYDVLDKASQKKCKRVAFDKITKTDILNALKSPRDIDQNLVDAQKARQVLDRLIGYKVSPVLWYSAHINKSSAGRVQSVALKLVCDRQREIDAFKPEDYWFIEALLKCEKGEFWAKVITKEKENRYVDDKISAQDLEKLKTAKYKMDKIEKAEKRNNPFPPFDTNSLQGSCSSVFGWSLSKSQTIAQKLYEAGKVTYIRTDSFSVAPEAITEVRRFIQNGFSKEYLPASANVYAKKSSAAAQEAHECIRPTHLEDEGNDIDSSDEQKMYKLIRARFIACQMTPQIIDTVAYYVSTDTGHSLIARGQSIKFAGWTEIYPYSKTKEAVLPPVSEKECLDLKDIKRTKHTTEPPARYNERTLANAMEKDGVGRPATRASIITSIQKKMYVNIEKGKGKGLIASDLGLRINDYLQPNFKDFFMDIKYTSMLEKSLDEIADGKKTYLDVVGSVYEILQKHIKSSESNSETQQKEQKVMGKCIVCKEGEIVEKRGQYGVFYSCNKWPDCKTVYTKAEDGTFSIKEKKQFKTTGKKCPDCQKAGRDGELVERSNKSSGDKFYGCSKYPKCTYSEQLDGTPSNKKSFKKYPKKEASEQDTGTGNDESNADATDDLDTL